MADLTGFVKGTNNNTAKKKKKKRKERWKKKTNGKYKQFLHVIMIQSNFKYLFPTSVKCSDYKILPFVHKMAKIYISLSRPWLSYPC